MSNSSPWLAIIGIGEDGLTGLSPSSREALAKAEIVFGGPRHLELAGIDARGRPWPVPFSVEPVLACRGRTGRGARFRRSVLARRRRQPRARILRPANGSPSRHPRPFRSPQRGWAGGWKTSPASACMPRRSRPCCRIWRRRAARSVCLRDGNAVRDLAAWLTQKGFGASSLSVMESLGGPSERIRTTQCREPSTSPRSPPPVAVAITAAGGGRTAARLGLAG